MTKQKDYKQKIRSICTYQAVKGTSGYDLLSFFLLSEEKFRRIFDVVEKERQKAYQEGMEYGIKYPDGFTVKSTKTAK